MAPRLDWAQLADVADALESVLKQDEGEGGGRPPAGSAAGVALLGAAGIKAATERLTRKLRAATRPAEAAALRRALRNLQQPWSDLSPGQQEAAILGAAGALAAVPAVIGPGVSSVVAGETAELIELAIVGTAEKLDLDILTSLNLVDERVVNFALRSQAAFLRNEFGQRQVAFANRAREIVASGLRRGLDPAAMGRELEQGLTAAALNRSSSYYRNVASIWANRARSYGLLTGMDRGGIAFYRFVAVMDRRTTEQCRFMHNRQFSVARGLEQFQQVAASQPEDISEIMPFMARGKDEDGNRILYYKRGDERITVAQVDRSGVGQLDRKGSYSRAMSDAELSSAGLTQPPLHGL
jgi:hypothetical protein